MAKYLTFTIVILIVVYFCLSCNTLQREKNNDFLYSEDKASTGVNIQDSLLSIISKARKVSCELIAKSPEDTTRTDSLRTLTKKEAAATEFVLFAPDNFKSDEIVYGVYRTWARFIFEDKKGKAIVDLDLGLSKWKMMTGSNKEIFRKDLSNREEILRLLRILFPKDITLKLLQKNLNTEIKP